MQKSTSLIMTRWFGGLILLVALGWSLDSEASFTQHDKCSASNGGSATTITCTLAGSGVSSGDLVVAVCGNDSSNTTVVTDASSTLTALNLASSGSARTQMHYILSSVATGLQTYTCTFGAASTVRDLQVYVYGHTGSVSFDAQDTPNAGISTSVVSGSLTITGSDELVFAYQYNENSAVSSVEKIHVLAPDDIIRLGDLSVWVKAFVSSTFTDTSTATIASSARWLSGSAGFKTSGAASSGRTFVGLVRH